MDPMKIRDNLVQEEVQEEQEKPKIEEKTKKQNNPKYIGLKKTELIEEAIKHKKNKREVESLKKMTKGNLNTYLESLDNIKETPAAKGSKERGGTGLFNMMIAFGYGLEFLGKAGGVNIDGYAADINDSKTIIKPICEDVYEEHEDVVKNYIAPIAQLAYAMGGLGLKRHIKNSNETPKIIQKKVVVKPTNKPPVIPVEKPKDDSVPICNVPLVKYDPNGNVIDKKIKGPVKARVLF